MNGTYAIRLYTAKDDYEKDQLILKQDEKGLRGIITEVLYRPLLLENGTVDGNSFSFQAGPFITILGDFGIQVTGKVEGDTISGQVMTLMGLVPFWGKRISETTPGLG